MENLILNIPLSLFFATLPSVIWLNFYLRKDKKPEPKSLILEVFFLGMVVSVPTIFVQQFFFFIFEKLNFPLILKIIFGIALVEEFFKFLVVRIKIFNHPELEEPVDTMIYMICAALGFAAAENLLLFLPTEKVFLSELAKISFLRYIGATFLHALASAILGFFIGVSFFRKKERLKLISFGLILATLLHGFYNFFIIYFEKKVGLFLSAILILVAAYFVSFCFEKLKE